MKKQIITMLTLFVLLFASVSAQNKTSLSQISGMIMDSRNAPIPYAEVFVGEVRDGEEKILQRTHTDLSARFSLSIAPGNYFFGVSHLGYKLYVSKITLLPNQDLDMGKITLQEDPTELQTVVVQGRSMTVRSTQTGFKVDVTKIREERNNALDLLAGLPNIFCTRRGAVHSRKEADHTQDRQCRSACNTGEPATYIERLRCPTHKKRGGSHAAPFEV